MSAEMVAFRRMLHTHPELSGSESITTELIAERLRVEGLEPKILGSGTGLVCDIPMSDDPTDQVRTIALRADIDALAMEDGKDVPYRSQRPGVAHACGHDVHTAALLGAALQLLELRRSEPMDAIVRLIFEPAEETMPGGAVEVIREGWLDGVEAIYGLHCDPKLDCGLIGLRVGSLTSASDAFEISLHGPGGHTARPERTIDLIQWAGRVAADLSHHVTEATRDCTVVLGTIHSGLAPNVIPATATLSGTLRTPDLAIWKLGEQILRTALATILDHAGAPEWTLEYTVGIPPVVNDEHAVDVVRAALQFEPVEVVSTDQSRGGDSFAWYLERIPGTYLRLGTHDPAGDGPRLDLHSANFDVDERAISIGSDVLRAAALGWLMSAQA
jgi:amidohydrolase